MSHLSSEVLRRYIDDPDVLLSYEKEHLLQCTRCRTQLDVYRNNARFSAETLAPENLRSLRISPLRQASLTSTRGVSFPWYLMAFPTKF